MRWKSPTYSYSFHHTIFWSNKKALSTVATFNLTIFASKEAKSVKNIQDKQALSIAATLTIHSCKQKTKR